MNGRSSHLWRCRACRLDQRVRLSQWFTSVREHKVLVLVCTLLATGATVAGTALQQERYSSAGMIGFRGPRVAATVAVPVDVQPPESRLERARNDILVRANLERIIQDLDLYAGERHRTPMEELIDRMRRDISLQLVDGPGELTRVHIGFTAGDPRQAQRVADRLAALFLDASSRDRRLMVESTDNYLESSIEELRVRIAEREQAIAESSSQSTGAPSQADTIEFQVLLDTYRQMLIDREAVRHAANLERRQIGEQFVLLDPARVPNRPEGPSRMAVGLVGSLVGLCLGVALAGVAGFRQRGSDELMT